MTDSATTIANALLDIGAVRFPVHTPLTFKSGLKAPLYIDNRTFIFHPQEWRLVIEAFRTLVLELDPRPQIIAGIETAGIPHSSVLSYELNLPSVFVRKQLKDHGTQIPIEGGDVNGKTVLLIEDNISTGMSSLHGVDALRAAGATVNDLFSITEYELDEAKTAFASANVRVRALTSVPTVIHQATERSMLSAADADVVSDWFADPHGWAARRGIA